jgi:phycoerythrobilin:ferredoxin oxidoreductase
VAYRAEKDPARGMLTRFHGAEWTEAYIHGVLFDL